MLDLYGLGNALVDTDVEIDDVFLSDEGLAKGQMTLVDSSRMANLVSKLEGRPMRKCSGGSAAATFFRNWIEQGARHLRADNTLHEVAVRRRPLVRLLAASCARP